MPCPVVRRFLSSDQRTVAAWFGAMLSSGRGPRRALPLYNALIDAGVPKPSYETIVKASRSEVALPAKYADALTRIYRLTEEESVAFAQAVALASMAPEAASLYRRAYRIPADLTVPDLSDAALATASS